MGMAVSIDVRDATCSGEAIDEVVRWLHHVDATFSTYREDSPITALGRGEIGLDEVADEVRDVLRRCEALRAESDGCFDAFAVPAPNGTTLDPSGYVKGWSIQVAAEILERHGNSDFCVNAGGDIVVRGRPSPDGRWRIGVRHPDDPTALALVLEADGPLAVATSATYERGAHIVDPRTGRPTTCVAGATVVGPDLATGDAYATALFVMGTEGIAWIEGRPGFEACVITHDEQVIWSSGFDCYRAR